MNVYVLTRTQPLGFAKRPYLLPPLPPWEGAPTSGSAAGTMGIGAMTYIRAKELLLDVRVVPNPRSH